MTQAGVRLSYTRDELLADHLYAAPQIEAGYRLHGGFDTDGAYVSPRTLHRWRAVEAWQARVEARGFPLIDATTRLLKRGNFPSYEQQSLMLSNGIGRSLWNSLTVTGVFEARGRALCDAVAPDFQNIIVEDVAETCTGHLCKGLLYAHGLDEGGDKANGQGGHDDMWFAVRDLLFGKGAYPLPVIPESLSRPEAGRRMPQIPAEYENWILLLMNVLMIEVRAESYFAYCVRLMRSPDLFTDRRAAADHAADLVERIRTDEAIHVAYLQALVSELRSFTFRTVDGGSVPGAALIDPAWRDMIEWHAITNPDHGRVQARQETYRLLDERPDAVSLRARFDALDIDRRTQEAAE